MGAVGNCVQMQCVRCLPALDPTSSLEKACGRRHTNYHSTQDSSSSCGSRTPHHKYRCNACRRVDTQGRRIDVKEQRRLKGHHPFAAKNGSRKRRARAWSFFWSNLRRFFLHFCFDYSTMLAKVFERLFEAFFAFVVFAASVPPHLFRDSRPPRPAYTPTRPPHKQSW